MIYHKPIQTISSSIGEWNSPVWALEFPDFDLYNCIKH